MPSLLALGCVVGYRSAVSYFDPVTQSASFSSRTRPSAVVYGPHASVTFSHTRCWTSDGRSLTSELIGGATARSHRVACSGESSS